LATLEPKREVVDGQQRLRTLISFIEPNILADYDEERDAFLIRRADIPELADTPFRQLPETTQRHILNYEFSVHVFPSDTEDREVLQIFARMNSTGVKANYQELRNAEFFGEFKRTAYRLAYEQLERWRNWGVFSEQDIARMLEVEETSDLILSFIRGERGKSQRAIDKVYGEFDTRFPHSEVIEDRFRTVMDKIDAAIGENLASLEYSRKTLFHTLAVFVYDLIYGLGSPVTEGISPKSLPKEFAKTVVRASRDIGEERLPEDLLRALRGATGDAKSRELRLHHLASALEDVATQRRTR